jgi:oligopeptide transport system permease protein
MTDIAAIPAAGRSLWADAWARLRTNRAAMISSVYLLLIAVVCSIGPLLTPNAFSTIHQNYTRVPPSLAPYPSPDMIEPALAEAVQKGRMTLASWEQSDSTVTLQVTATKPIDERVARYVDRSDMFENAAATEIAADGLSATMTAQVQQK